MSAIPERDAKKTARRPPPNRPERYPETSAAAGNDDDVSPGRADERGGAAAEPGENRRAGESERDVRENGVESVAGAEHDAGENHEESLHRDGDGREGKGHRELGRDTP